MSARGPTPAPSLRCEPSTSSSARSSRETTQVGRRASEEPAASTRVPGASGRIVLRMRIGTPDSMSGTMVRGWNMRRPRPASSRASRYESRGTG
jgi:hypothetical protein